MKRKVIVISIIILLVAILLMTINGKDKNKAFMKDGVMYALVVNGEPASNFPTKGLYRVDTECTNATCKWDYDAWKLNIENITGNVSCNITFTTISKTNFNDYIISLSGTTQGTGSVVHETFVTENYTNATASQYYSSSNTSTSGTTVTNAFYYNGTKWVSRSARMNSGTNYHITFTIPSDGNYQFCYELSSGSPSNRLYLYKGTTAVLNYVSASSSSTTSSCIDLGNVTSGTKYRVVQHTYKTIATIKFSIKGDTKTVDTGYRYEGKDPNNYVWFNNELWRIIGVFDETTHGVTGTNLVKIIRANSIGGLVWDKSNSNTWTSASLYKLLNGAYYNGTNGTSSGYCYGYSTTIIGNCDYTEMGIQDAYRGMIQKVTWKLGGTYSDSATATEFYSIERSGTNSVENYIGLMHVSDYGFATLATSCARTTNSNLYNTEECSGQNWLYGQGSESTLHSYIDGNSTARVSNLSEYGRPGGSVTNISYGTRPTLYLNSDIYLLSGDGSQKNPYILGM